MDNAIVQIKFANENAVKLGLTTEILNQIDCVSSAKDDNDPASLELYSKLMFVVYEKLN